MAKQYMPLEDCSGSAVVGGEIPQLRPPAFSDNSKYTTFTYTYYPRGLEISDSYIYYPGGSEISEAVAWEIPTFAVPPTNYLGGLEISDSYIYYPGGSEISEAVAKEIPPFAVPPTNYLGGLEISDSYIYYPGGSEISEAVAKEIPPFAVPPTNYLGGLEISEAVVPNISTPLYAIKATIDFSKAKGDLQAVLMAHDGCFGGHSFHIYQGKLCYVYNWLGQQQKITCYLPRLSGEVKLKVEFAKPKIIAPSDETLGDSAVDKMKLYINNIEQNVDIIITFSNYTPNFLTQYKHEIP
ncbi:hypothetical protein [Microcystis sp. M064S2]|jgi:hypothetical protein|uniref:hypothetical protein n=1 Tax=Microcystis sp. M064S2 TaxID=2771172 RepID=UPI002586E43C|nr:hypothetical protein [Microcystis sp. M064S2]